MKVLYAVKIGNPDYMEEIITSVETRIEKAKQWATDNGFNRFRIAKYSDVPEKPDFVKTINCGS